MDVSVQHIVLPQLCQKTIVLFSTAGGMLEFLWVKGGGVQI